MVEYEKTGDLLVELGSDQTSLHNPFNGGYYPVQVSFEEAEGIMKDDPDRFKELIKERYDLLILITINNNFIINNY